MSEIRNTYAQACVEAGKKGLQVVEAASNQLFIDIDDERDVRVFTAGLEVLREILELEQLGGEPLWRCAKSSSRKRGHMHITVTLPRPVADEKERILFQALLGSDRMREILNLKRVAMGETRGVTLFFEKKAKTDARKQSEKETDDGWPPFG